MGSVFLSYAREDRACAAKLAQALETVGHEVWWDRRLDGGEEFSAEIEAALGKQPRWRHNGRLTWSPGGAFSLSLHWRYIGKVRVDRSNEDVPFPVFLPPPSPLVAKIDAQNYFDLTGLFNFQGKYSLRLGVRNIFDHEPPVVAGGTAGACGSSNFGILCNGNTYPQLYDPLGRYFFAGATVDF